MPHIPKQIKKDDSAGREAQRRRHVEHRPLPSAHARFRERLDVIRHRLDAGVGAAAERVGAQEQRGDEYPSKLLRQARSLLECLGHERGQSVCVQSDTQQDEHRMSGEESEKDRQQHLDGLAHPAQIEDNQQQNHAKLGRELELMCGHRQEAEHRIDTARDRDCYRQHVVDDERRT